MADTKTYAVFDSENRPVAQGIVATEVQVSTSFIRFVQPDGTWQEFPPDYRYAQDYQA